MIFTHHAIERYRQFHMLDRPVATDEDARAVLETHAAEAVRLPARTHRGDEVWAIQALGIELVVKRDTPDPTCVTVLPPTRFRGLTPLQAEHIEAAAIVAKERAAEDERQHTEAQAAVARAVAESKEAKRAAVKARSEAKAAEAVARKVDAAQAQRDLAERLREAKNAAALAFIERDILLSMLKTMRVQMTAERDADRCRAALRIAVRALLDGGATEALTRIAAIDPGLASEAFANGSKR